MASITTKVIVGLVSAGGIAGGSYLVSVLNDPTDSIQNYLKKNNFKLRKDGWDTLLASYFIETDGNDELKIGDGLNDFIPDEEFIQKWCQKNLKENVKSNNDNEFKKATYWCVEFKTIEEEFKGRFETRIEELAKKYQDLPLDIKEAVDKLVFANENNEEGHRIQKWCNNNKKMRVSNDNKNYVEKIKQTCLKD